MGSCNSLISSASKMEKYRIIEEIKKVDEIEETPVVAICIRCPSDTGSWQSHLEIKPATEKVSSTCSIEVKDIEFIDEFFSDLSVNERDVTHSQTEVLGMRNQDHELRERYDAQEQSIKNNLNSFTAGSKKEERQLKPASIDDEESSSWAIELPGVPGSSGIHTVPNLPPPRPSLWKELYLKMIKPKEKLAENKLKNTPRSRPKKNPVSKVKQRMRAFRTRPVLKRIQKSMRRKASYSRQPNCIIEVQPRHEDMVRIYDVDCHGDSSSSVSPASSRSSSAASHNSSITSDENPEESSVSRHHRHRGVESTSEKVRNGETGVAKSEWKQSKNGPLSFD